MVGTEWRAVGRRRRTLPAINAIYNREIREGVATWDLDEWSEAARLDWFRAHSAPGLVVLVADLPGKAAVPAESDTPVLRKLMSFRVRF